MARDVWRLLDAGFGQLALDHALKDAVGLGAAQDLPIDEEARRAANTGDLTVEAVDINLVDIAPLI